MKAIATLAVLLFVFGQISARDNRLSDECLNGIKDKNECCDGVPDAWYAHLRNPADCGSFYQCEHGKPTWKACPSTLHWSVETDQCDWPQNAKCDANPGEGGNGGNEGGNNGGNEGGNNGGNEGGNNGGNEGGNNGGNEGGNNGGNEGGNNGGNEGGNNGGNEGNNETDECAPEPVCHQCITGVFPAELCCRDVKTYHKLNLANSEDCTSYYTCANGHAVLRHCPDGLHWSIETDRCEWPKVAKCDANNGGGNDGGNGNDGGSGEGGNNGGDGGSGEGGNNGGNGSGEGGNNGGGDESGETGNGGVSQACLEGEIDAETCCKNVPYWIDVLLQNNKDCHTYFQCVHGKPMVRPCPSNLWWSIKNNRCEWKENASCTWESQPTK